MLWTALVGGLALVPLSQSHPDLLGSIAALAGASLAMPQALTLLCHPDRSAAGVSATTWALVGCKGALWLTYGLLVDLFRPDECARYFAAAGYDAT